MAQFLFGNLVGTTLAGAISTTATTIYVAAGTGILFPQPVAGQQFGLRLISASNPSYYEIVYVTAVSGDALTVVRAQEGTIALTFNASDFAKHVLTAGALSSFALAANSVTIVPRTTFYVNGVTGNDSNPGTIALPFATIQGAINYISQYQSGLIITVNVAAGTYTPGSGVKIVANVPSSLIAGWNFVGAGVGSSIIDASAIGCTGFRTATNSNVTISGFTIKAYYDGINAGGVVTVGTIAFVLTNVGTSSGISTYTGAVVQNASGATWTFSGSGYAWLTCWKGSMQIGYHDVNGSLPLTIVFSSCTVSGAGVSALFAGTIHFDPTTVTWTSAPTGSRYAVGSTAVIDTNGSGTSYIPGSTAGTIDSASYGVYK